MDKIIVEYLSGLELGEPQVFENMSVVPLLAASDAGPEYLTLEEALRKKAISITELGEGGSVPELKVTNKGETPVLLMDGEELAGAKQNRVLNTTILIPARSKTVIPVSCTEQGRWFSVSREFAPSEAVMHTSGRAKKAASVSASLREGRRFLSDQVEVWDELELLACKAEVASSTGAMRDVFRGRSQDLDQRLRAFPHVPRQHGLLVLINGQVAGLDILSMERAYKTLHAKMVKSYAMEAIVQEAKESRVDPVPAARSFIERAMACEEKRYESVGHGHDYRFESADIVGSALVYQDAVIHAAFFSTDGAATVGPMARFRLRRGFRA